ncbi:MAG TPA: hypothetical protein VGT40_27070 [Methylomirabilota bacterium]|jgi:hypothetical protein|nr:hypothetical protein [Methylomirabilota bacterium]
MTKAPFAASLLLLLGLALGPGAARAEQFRDVNGLHPVIVRPFEPVLRNRPVDPNRLHPFPPAHAFARPFRHPPFVSFGYALPVYLPSPMLYASPAYGDPIVYDQPVAYATPASTPRPPMPSVIEYPGGRYELRGDGVTTAYVWVWIPNPPSGPPPETSAASPPPPPSAPPPSAVPAPPPATSSAPSPRREAYRWMDEQGVVYWTDRWETIPEQYRTQAKRLAL